MPFYRVTVDATVELTLDIEAPSAGSAIRAARLNPENLEDGIPTPDWKTVRAEEHAEPKA